MGVSSERTGPTGPGQHGTDGLRDTSIRVSREPDSPERPDAVEENPEGLAPKAGYPSLDPRSD
jgi:hypothetical protein